MFKYNTATGTAAWTDLLRSLKDGPVPNLRGSPKLKSIGNKAYWYGQYRIGKEVIDQYIGENSEHLRDQISRHKTIVATEKQARRERARLIRILRAEGYLMTDMGSGQILSSMAKLDVFRLGGILVGTPAFRAYQGELGVQIGFDEAAETDDLDIASFEHLSVVLGDFDDTQLVDAFSKMKFDPVPVRNKGKIWKWRQTDRETLVEFLIPSFGGNEKVRDLPALGVSAQCHQFLDYLIADPIQAPLLYRSGALIRIPRPERFAIHKLIIADRRRGCSDAWKSRKDRAQAEFLIEVLHQDRPEDLAEAYEEALDRGPAWQAHVSASLKHMPKTKHFLASMLKHIRKT
ncbi:nucleotidyltransferase family protein [Ruegeria atlantica]|uniref:nucleotidyltransferase family protein n=1 Tax=Ruegeria atlantica TaxID=81569 RepID=UPI00147C3434|nr:GSU2403 family nucleotidyltransferase fold protein [Ruegeria atlantica]